MPYSTFAISAIRCNSRRIQDLEQEIRRLKLNTRHLDDEREYELNYNELVMYGFDDIDEE